MQRYSPIVGVVIEGRLRIPVVSIVTITWIADRVSVSASGLIAVVAIVAVVDGLVPTIATVRGAIGISRPVGVTIEDTIAIVISIVALLILVATLPSAVVVVVVVIVVVTASAKVWEDAIATRIVSTKIILHLIGTQESTQTSSQAARAASMNQRQTDGVCSRDHDRWKCAEVEWGRGWCRRGRESSLASGEVL